MEFEPIFRNRVDAGKKLAKHVADRLHEPDILVLGLPRGGVPVASEVARVLHAELDVFLVRKLGLPGQEELAIGAIASGGVRVLNESVIEELQLAPKLIEHIAKREEQELKRREQLYRNGRPARPVHGRAVMLVDDGLATGASLKAAARAIRLQGPRRVIAAVPVAAKETCDEFRTEIDEMICAYTPQPFLAVGMWYEDFSQTTDEEVQRILEQAVAQHPSP
ncbi:MAG TPA: phosphoribosyltransferase [Bryobacteraceae bacterium]|nr:phosphoribosyltransferase [Bryobacteraceae bacterium]